MVRLDNLGLPEAGRPRTTQESLARQELKCRLLDDSSVLIAGSIHAGVGWPRLRPNPADEAHRCAGADASSFATILVAFRGISGSRGTTLGGSCRECRDRAARGLRVARTPSGAPCAEGSIRFSTFNRDQANPAVFGSSGTHVSPEKRNES
jgi:hypothetical protein